MWGNSYSKDESDLNFEVLPIFVNIIEVFHLKCYVRQVDAQKKEPWENTVGTTYSRLSN